LEQIVAVVEKTAAVAERVVAVAVVEIAAAAVVEIAAAAVGAGRIVAAVENFGSATADQNLAAAAAAGS